MAMRMPSILAVAILLVIHGISGAVVAQEAYVECSNKTSSAKYEHQYNLDEFFIFYNTSGQHSIGEQKDINNNLVPDLVEDIAMQLITMRDVLSFLGFKHPFEQYRYMRVNVDRIHVVIRDRARMGVAFDPSHRDVSKGEDAPCVLLIGLSNRVRSGNLTPAHELFHLYQYGYTVFKNRWYLEGMARWAEGLLAHREHPIRSFPETVVEQETLFAESYGAVSFWESVIEQVSDSSEVRVYPKELLGRGYLNGGLVIDDKATPRGASIMIAILEAFDRLDREISMEIGRTPKSWSNSQRRDPENNSVMFMEVLKVTNTNILQ